MSYEKDMKATWDEYAKRMALEHDPEETFRIGRRIGFEKVGKRVLNKAGKRVLNKE